MTLVSAPGLRFAAIVSIFPSRTPTSATYVSDAVTTLPFLIMRSNSVIEGPLKTMCILSINRFGKSLLDEKTYVESPLFRRVNCEKR